MAEAGSDTELVLISVVTCPACKATSQEQMPVEACQFFWECPACGQVARPIEGDCCVYCSYGTVSCPSIQRSEPCGPSRTP